MESILESLLELEGVRGSFIIGAKGQITHRKTHPIYDQSMLQKASTSVERCLDSLEVQHGEWDSVVVHFSEGKLLLRNLGSLTLAIICDGGTNLAFANVAINVATKKLKQAIASGQLDANAPPQRSGAEQVGSLPSMDSLSLSGSGLGASGSKPAVALDQGSTEFLPRCTKALSKAVGPMAKIFVKEAVRNLAKGGRFTADHIPQLVKMLEEKIESPQARVEFRHDCEV
jgi:predicted regulator of Ras-like GTPase activity (Roadblock/LC7/MglB family)